MVTLYNYLFYRIAKAYKALDDKYYHNWSHGLLFVTFGFIILSVLVVVVHMMGYTITRTLIYIGTIPTISLDFYFSNYKPEYGKDKYKRLEKKYKHEKYKIIKGVLVALYVVGSFVLYCAALAICNP